MIYKNMYERCLLFIIIFFSCALNGMEEGENSHTNYYDPCVLGTLKFTPSPEALKLHNYIEDKESFDALPGEMEKYRSVLTVIQTVRLHVSYLSESLLYTIMDNDLLREVACLLALKSDSNTYSNFIRNMAQAAVRSNNVGILQFLARSGINLNMIRLINGGSLWSILLLSNPNIELIEFFRDNGIEPNRSSDMERWSLEHNIKAVKKLLRSCYKDQPTLRTRLKNVLLLLDKYNFHEKKEQQKQAFLNAASEGNGFAVARLLSEGVDCNKIFDKEGNTALGLARRGGHSAVVKLLLRYGARGDKCDKETSVQSKPPQNGRHRIYNSSLFNSIRVHEENDPRTEGMQPFRRLITRPYRVKLTLKSKIDYKS